MIKIYISLLLILSLVNADEIDSALELAHQGKFEEAIDVIMPLANNNNPEAQYWLAYMFLELNNLEEHKKLLYEAAYNNHPQAQYDIAWSMSEGWLDASIETLVEIIYWYEKSGYNGNTTNAYANLSVLYDDETAAIQNRRKILNEMEIAANNGNSMAQYNMGWIYARGLLKNNGELMQDLDIAKSWFQKSAKLGFEDAVIILEKNFNKTTKY
jgi:TPR repeat protein